MLKRLMLLAPLLAVWIAVATAQVPAPAARRVLLGDWPEARGPRGDGRSDEKALIDKWTLNGQNFLWRAPYGGRSAPVVMGNRVYVQNPAGLGDQMQERVMALDADSGKLVWEYKFNVFQSDVPPHRVGWASPAIDPDTGNIYAMGVGATVIALSKDGTLLWDHSIGEEFAAFTTHGGRTTSPIIDGNLVIVSAAISSWGTGASRQHRFVALDKRSGEIIWIASPGGRPYDTNYAAPLITRIKDLRLLISGSGDGGVYAMKPQTGEKVWGTVIAKRAVNTGVVVVGNDVIVSHGDENLDVPELGMVGAIDGSQSGDIKTVKWAQKGDQFGFSSPVVDGSILYIVENGSRLKAYDTETGKSLWTQTLGTIQKAPLVFADGKLYAGTESGKFFIVKPSATGAQVLSEVEMPLSKDDNAGQTAGIPEPIFGGAAISRGRIFFVSTGGVYAIGAKTAAKPTGFAVNEPADTGAAPAAWVQVYPTEVVIKAGEKQAFHARTFDGRGRFLHEEPAATFALAGLKGTIDANGVFTADAAAGDQAGIVKATVGGLSGEARARVVRPLPWTETFESVRRRRRPARLDHRRHGEDGGRHHRRTEGALQGARQHHLQALPRLRRRRESLRLHDRGRRPRHDEAAADVGSRRHRAALLADSLRQRAAADAATVGAGDQAHRLGTVQVGPGHLVSPEAASREHARRQGARARQGLADGPARARGVDDREDRSHRQSQGGARLLHRRGVRCLHRQHQGREKPMKKILAAVVIVSGSALISASDPGSGDWPMWGGTPDRNMVSNMKGLPIEWDVKTKKNVKWVANLGSQSYGNPVVAAGMVFVGTNNEGMRDPKQGGIAGC